MQIQSGRTAVARILLLLVLTMNIAACDFVGVMKDGMQQSEAVAKELEETTGIRPQVGFNWQNGRLASVTVFYPRIHETKSLRDLAAAARTAIGHHFKDTPDNILLTFSAGKDEPAGTRI